MNLIIKQSATDYSADFSTRALARILFEDFALAKNTRFVVAYSGGCDSHVLLHALVSLRNQSGITVMAAHFDHGLQNQSAIWAKQCERWCNALEVDFVSARRTVNVELGESIEANARDARYHWLDEISQPEQVVVSAHHADDQAETFLLHLFQGKEIEQLSGIAPARALVYGSQNQLIRPLLGFSKAQLMRYAVRKKLQWIDDPMNNDVQHYRNYIRHELMPRLSQRWPGIVTALNQATDSCRRIAERNRAKLSASYKGCCSPESRGIFCLTEPLHLAQFLHPAVANEESEFIVTGLIRYWIHNAGYASPSKGQLATLYEQIVVQQATQATLEFNAPNSCLNSHPNSTLNSHPNRLAARYYNRHLYLTNALQSRRYLTMPWDMQAMRIPEYGIAVEIVDVESGGIHRSAMQGKKIDLAWRKGGERVRLNNRQHHAALKKLLQANYIPPWERDCLPFLKINGEIAWVHGIGGLGKYAADSSGAGIRPQFSRLNDRMND